MTPEERKALVKKFDKDGDGKLNQKERKAMMEHLRAQRGERGDRRRGGDGSGDKPGAKPGDKPSEGPSDKPGVKPGDKPSAKPPVRGEGGRRRPGADKKKPGGESKGGGDNA